MEIKYKKIFTGRYGIMIDDQQVGEVVKVEDGSWEGRANGLVFASSKRKDSAHGVLEMKKRNDEVTAAKAENVQESGSRVYGVKLKEDGTVNMMDNLTYCSNYDEGSWDQVIRTDLSRSELAADLNEKADAAEFDPDWVCNDCDHSFKFGKLRDAEVTEQDVLSVSYGDHKMKAAECPNCKSSHIEMEDLELQDLDDDGTDYDLDDDCDLCGGTGRVADDILCWKCEQPLKKDDDSFLDEMAKDADDHLEQLLKDYGTRKVSAGSVATNLQRAIYDIKENGETMVKDPDLIDMVVQELSEGGIPFAKWSIDHDHTGIMQLEDEDEEVS